MLRFRILAITSVIGLSIGVLHPGSVAADAKPWKEELPIRQPVLRDSLPDGTVIYLRVPHLFGILTAPKGNALDAAMRSQTNVANVMKIRKGIVDNVLPLLPAFEDARLRSIEENLRSPIEIAIRMSPAPSALIAANIDPGESAGFDRLLSNLSDESYQISLVAPLNEDGVGELQGLPAPAFVQFDQASGAMLLNVGPGVNRDSFAATLDAVSGDTSTRMRSMERRIDDSGQGFFAWIDAEQAIPTMKLFIQPEEFEKVSAAGLDKLSALGFGWGVADGKGRIAIVADMREDLPRGLLPVMQSDLDAKSVGEPDGLFVLSIPTRAEFLRLEAAALALAGEDAIASWNEGKEAILKATGVALEDAFDAIGPEFLMIFDRAGDYAAVRVRDTDVFDRLVSKLAEVGGSEIETRRIRGKTYKHLSFPSDLGFLDQASAEKLGWAGVLLDRQSEHTYWTRDGDFVYFSAVPQPLIDRYALRARTDVGKWMSEEQRIDASATVLSISGRSRKLPRRLYTFYIELSQLLADIADVDIDVWSMPTPAQLDLPERGTLGFTVNLGNPRLSAELTFENNPAELLGGGGASSVAMVGILAAIAIPAYQDYTIRAKVSEGLNLSNSAKAETSSHYLDMGRFPNAAEALEMSSFDYPGKYTQSIVVEPDTGRIIITFDAEEIPNGGEIWLEPSVEDGYVEWMCSATLQDKHVPAFCR